MKNPRILDGSITKLREAKIKSSYRGIETDIEDFKRLRLITDQSLNVGDKIQLKVQKNQMDYEWIEKVLINGKEIKDHEAYYPVKVINF